MQFKPFKTLLALTLLGLSQLALAQTVWLDVRSGAEFQQEHLENSHNIPHTQIKSQIESLNIDKQDTIKVYCRSGRRSALAVQELHELGYSKAVNVGGIEDARKLQIQ